MAGRRQHTRRSILTAGEVEILAEHLGGGYGLLVLTAAYTGMRWSELAALRRSRLVLAPRSGEEAAGFIPYIQVDPDTGALHRGPGGLGPPKSVAAGREVHLPDFLAALLNTHLSAAPGAFVFTARCGGHLHASNFRSRVWKPALAGLADAGRIPRVGDLETMTFHQLRHTHKTWMAEHHTPPSLQDYRMGHAPRGVQSRYEHHTHAMITGLMHDLQHRHETATGGAPARPPALPLDRPARAAAAPTETAIASNAIARLRPINRSFRRRRSSRARRQRRRTLT